MENNEYFGPNLRRIIDKSPYKTYSSAAKALKISLSFLNQLMNGKRTPSLSMLAFICETLKVTSDDLLMEYKGEKPQSPLDQAVLITQAQLKALSEEANKKGAETVIEAINKPIVSKIDNSPRGEFHRFVETLSQDEAKYLLKQSKGLLDAKRDSQSVVIKKKKTSIA